MRRSRNIAPVSVIYHIIWCVKCCILTTKRLQSLHISKPNNGSHIIQWTAKFQSSKLKYNLCLKCVMKQRKMAVLSIGSWDISVDWQAGSRIPGALLLKTSLGNKFSQHCKVIVITERFQNKTLTSSPVMARADLRTKTFHSLNWANTLYADWSTPAEVKYLL